jgi:hypothetical protein
MSTAQKKYIILSNNAHSGEARGYDFLEKRAVPLGRFEIALNGLGAGAGISDASSHAEGT